MDPDLPVDQSRLPLVAAVVVAAVGLATASLATHLTLAAGETPVTVLPASLVAAGGLAVVVAVRAVAVLVLWAAVSRRAPRLLPHALAAAGTALFLLGTWQTWLMLART